METIGLASEPPKNPVDTDVSEKNNYCKVCWQEKGEYKCIGGMICSACLNKLPYEMRGDIADVLIYDAIRAAKKYGGPTRPPQTHAPGINRPAGAVAQSAPTGSAPQGDANPSSQPVQGETQAVEGVATQPGSPEGAYTHTPYPTTQSTQTMMTPPVKQQPKKHLIIYGAVLAAFVIAAIALLLSMHLGSGSSNLDSEEILSRIQESGIVITDSITYDETTDPEGLLGEEGEYTSKTVFAADGFSGFTCSIEVFDNSEEADARGMYLETSSSLSFFYSPTVYVHENVVMVLDYNLSSQEVAEYENALDAAVDGEIYKAPTDGEGSSNTDSDDYTNSPRGTDDSLDSYTTPEDNDDDDDSNPLDSISPLPLQ